MLPLMNFNELIQTAALAGITLSSSDIAHANLYVICDQAGHNLYVGKANSRRRHVEEEQFPQRFNRKTTIVSGFLHLVEENQAERKPLLFDPLNFDRTKLDSLITKYRWSGDAISTLQSFLSTELLTPSLVEEALIRIHVRAGKLIGNSQHGSQWENPIGKPMDTIAAIAVDEAWNEAVLRSSTPGGKS